MSLKMDILAVVQRTSEQVTAAEIADQLGVSRNTVSHHLNRLAEDGYLEKSIGRPVEYKQIDQVNKKNDHPLIGKEGSLKSVIQNSKAAVSYPPNGLSVLFKGDSGVGKSYIAKYIYHYCKRQGLINSTVPLFTLNCADYATNPELLSANLFGYKKGAFTGAEKDEKGMLEKANGSVLFLDEIHRLSAENQEKLLLFMDNGTFSRLGESGVESHSTVRLLFATTEEIDTTLLTTFRRRISLKVEIPNYSERPYSEKVGLILTFLQQEQRMLSKDIFISARVIDFFLSNPFEGNIGEMRNLIKVMCANAYRENDDPSRITILFKDHAEFMLNTEKESFLEEKEQCFLVSENTTVEEFEEFGLLLLPDNGITGNTISEIEANTKLFFNNFLNAPHARIAESESFVFQDIHERIKSLSKCCLASLGIDLASDDITKLAKLVYYSLGIKKGLFDAKAVKMIRTKRSKSFYFAKKMVGHSALQKLESSEQDIVSMLTLMFSRTGVDEDRIPAVLMAHGDSTAKSIGAVVNRLLGEVVFESLDLDLDSTPEDILIHLKGFLSTVNTSNGLIFVVDMGSLEQLYEPLKRFISGELVLINYLSTPLALDIGLKLQTNIPVSELASILEGKHTIDLKSYEGFAKGANIIISCISGLGIAQKIKEILLPFFKETELITMDYQKLTNALIYEKKHFDQTEFILTTTPVHDQHIASINIEELISSVAPNETLLAMLGEENYRKMTVELIRFFSIEGAGTRLSFLNPAVIIGEMSAVISDLEQYFSTGFQSFLKMNLLMHLSLMIERIMLGNETKNFQATISFEEQRFIDFIHANTKNIEKKYNIFIPDDEIILIYQIIKTTL